MSLNLEGSNGGSFCLVKAATAISGTTTAVQTAAAISTVIDGAYQASRAANATIAFVAVSTSFVITAPVPIGSSCNFGLWVDTAGNFRFTQGPVTPVALASAAVGVPPNPGGGWAPVALVKVNVGATAAGSFVAGTTALNATGTTATYQDQFSAASASF